MTRHQVEIIAFHGWAHDVHCWDSLKLYFPDEIRLTTWDRGYFGLPNEIVGFQATTSPKILIAHSFGLHFIPEELIQQADGIVFCSTFVSFGKEKILKRMHDSMKTNMGYVLSQFHANCAYPLQSDWRMPRNFSGKLLLDDLEQLSTSIFDPEKIKTDLPLLMLSGDSDRIVDKENIHNLAKLLAMNVVTVPKSGHGFIYTRPEITANHILKFINTLTS